MTLVINIEELLQAVSPDQPCGENLEYDPDFVALEQAAQGKAEQQFGDSVVEAEGADWRAVKKHALALFPRTKDLRVAVYLTRALLVVEGLPGFHSGLALVHGLIEAHWDHLHPELDADDDNDPTMRMNTLLNLCGQRSMLSLLRDAEVVNTKGLGRYTFGDVLVAEGKIPPVGEDPPPAMDSIEAAFLGADLEHVEANTRAVQAAAVLVQTIDTEVTAKVGETRAVSLSPLADLLKELSTVMTNQLARRGVGAGGDENAPVTATGGDDPVVDVPVASGDVRTREDVIRLIDRACDYFDRYEPSSPVPILLRRAKNLIHKDFLEIVRDIAPAGVQEVERIRGADPQ